MGKTIELQKINIVSERDFTNESGYPLGTLRFYISNMFLGRAVPTRNRIECYRFENYITELIVSVPASVNLSLEEIQTHIECSLKEFTKKTVKWVK